MIVLSKYENIPGIYLFEYRIITFYGFMYLISCIMCFFLIKHIGNENEIKYREKIINYTLFGAICGGRIGYFLFYDIHLSIIEIFSIWNGGMSFHGGILGVLFSSYFLSINTKMKYFEIVGLLSRTIPICIFFVRIGNFVNQECVGIICKYGVIFQNYDNEIRFPTQLLEAFLEGLLIFILNIKYKENSISRFAILYSLFRIFCECFKNDHTLQGQLFSIPILLIGIIFRFYNM